MAGHTPQEVLERFFCAPPGRTQQEFEQELSQELARRIIDGLDDPKLVTAISVMLAVSETWKFEPIVAAIDQVFANGKGSKSAILVFNKILQSGNEGAKARIKDVYSAVTRRGRMFDLIYQANQTNDHDLTALCIIEILKFNPANEVHQHFAESQHGHNIYNELLGNPKGSEELVKSIASQILSVFTLQEVVSLHRDYGSLKLLMTEILNLLILDDGNINIPFQDFLISFDIYEAAFGAEGIERLTLQITSKQEFINYIENSFISATPINFHLFLAKADKDVGKKYRDFASAKLEQVSTENWLQSLKNSDGRLMIAQAIKSADSNFELGSSFRSSLEQYIDGILSGEVYSSNSNINWKNIPTLLSKAAETTFYKNVRDKFIARESLDGFYKIIELVGDQIFEKGDFVGKSKADELMRHLFIPMLSSEQGILVLSNNIKTLAGSYKNSSKETQILFIEEIKEKMGVSDDSKSELYFKILEGAEIKTDLKKRFFEPYS